MDISINTNHSANKAELNDAAMPSAPQGTKGGRPLLSITHADVASADDNLGIDVPDAALSRGDSLGKLIRSAFNYPPPPMPNFN